MSQAVVGYVLYASDVILICWFGTQLTQHVRKDILLFFVELLKKDFLVMCMEP
jgi:hypothetical protein